MEIDLFVQWWLHARHTTEDHTLSIRSTSGNRNISVMSYLDAKSSKKNVQAIITALFLCL